jgi:hypothetical protein
MVLKNHLKFFSVLGVLPLMEAQLLGMFLLAIIAR